jgi:peptidoglycan/LPS O-acetylase OafA/YrhL
VIGRILPIPYNMETILHNLTLTQRFFKFVPSIVLPEWSLSYEMEMYLVLPALYILIRARPSTRVPIIYAGVLAISFLLCIYYPFEVQCSFLSLFAFAPRFAAGMVAYHLHSEGTKRVRELKGSFAPSTGWPF